MNNNVDVLFLIKGECSFVMRSLMEKLGGAKITTGKVEAELKSLKNIVDLPKFFIADAEMLMEDIETRVFLYDLCIEKNRKLMLIGDISSLKSINEVTATNVIIDSFTRPVNYDAIVKNTKKYIDEFIAKGEKKNILIIDDSPTFLRLISEWLENDYNTSICPSATAAFHMIENKRH